MATVIEHDYEGYKISLKLIEAYEASVIRPDGSELTSEELFADNESDSRVIRHLEDRIGDDILRKEAEESEREYEAEQQARSETTCV